MSAANFLRCFTATLKHEGGYVNHPRDPGGATNFGVIQRTYDAYRRNKGLNTQSVREISKDEVAEIYRKQYWSKVNGDELPDGLDYVAYDAGVNSGPSRGAKWLQQALKVTPDGVVGQITVDKARAASDKKAIVRLACQLRMGFLRRLGHWKTFRKGWTRRVTEVEALAVRMVIEALAMASAAAPVPRPSPVPVAAAASVATPPAPPTVNDQIEADAREEAGNANRKAKQDVGTATGGAVAGGTSGTQVDPQAAADGFISSWLFMAVVVIGAVVFVFFLWRSSVNKERERVYKEVAAALAGPPATPETTVNEPAVATEE